MELIKLSEAYNIVDDTDKFTTSGSLNKDMSGAITINLSSAIKTDDQSNQWCSANYSISAEGSVSVNYSFGGAYKEDFVDYCEDLITGILNTINSLKSNQ